MYRSVESAPVMYESYRSCESAVLLEYGWVIMLYVSSVQRVESISHKTDFPFLSILLSEPSQANAQQSV